MRPALDRVGSIAAISVVASLIIAANTRVALAQNATAEALFSDGERLLAEGKVAAACDAFEASNRTETRAGTLLNLGLCREQNNQLASAWSAFKDAESRAKDPKKKQLAADRIAVIEPKLSYLTISVADESRVDGLVVTRNGAPVDAALWNRALPVDGGSYTIAGHAPGHEQWSTTVDVPVEQGKLSVEVPRFKELAKLVTAPSAQPVTGDTHRDTQPGHAASTFTGKRKLAVGVAAIGVVALAGGVVLGLQAKAHENDAFALCPDVSMPCADGARANELLDQGHSRAMLANIGYAAGGAALIGAGVLWFVGRPTESERRVSVVPRAGATSVGLDLTARF